MTTHPQSASPSTMTTPNVAALLSLIPQGAAPQRSVLQDITRALRSGWTPTPEQRQQLIQYATRALIGHDRLRMRGRELLRLLGEPIPAPEAERPAGAKPDASAACPSCRGTGSIARAGRGAWTCHKCGSALKRVAGGFITLAEWETLHSKARRRAMIGGSR